MTVTPLGTKYGHIYVLEYVLDITEVCFSPDESSELWPLCNDFIFFFANWNKLPKVLILSIFVLKCGQYQVC